jgi:hypothetical protein
MVLESFRKEEKARSEAARQEEAENRMLQRALAEGKARESALQSRLAEVERQLKESELGAVDRLEQVRQLEHDNKKMRTYMELVTPASSPLEKAARSPLLDTRGRHGVYRNVFDEIRQMIRAHKEDGL